MEKEHLQVQPTKISYLANDITYTKYSIIFVDKGVKAAFFYS